MKILQVCPKFHHSVASGSTKVAYCISKELARRGHSVTVYTSDMKDKYTIIDHGVEEKDGVKVHRFQSVGTIATRETKIFVTPTIIPNLKKGTRSFDVIHIHEYRSFQGIVVHHYAKKYNVPYVLQAHGSLPRIVAWRRLKWGYDVLFGYRLLRDASKVVALSRVEAQQYKAMGVPEEKIAIIPNGIDLSEYADLPPKGSFKKKFNIPKDRKIILYLGRIHKTKGIDFLIRAYTHLKNEMNFKDAILVIAGPDDGYLNETKVLANSLGVCSSITFTGFISNKDKLGALVDADVFVTPSFYGFPMTFLEACVAGTPIITTSLGDVLEWIDRNVGFVVQPTPHDLAEAIYRIISNNDLRKKFSGNCIKVVRSNFLLEKVVERVEKVYEEVVERYAP
ncbi:MAG: glycosyltransferase [Candidatus Baldrarchaeia archaeon]